jgi:hypothetical protein
MELVQDDKEDEKKGRKENLLMTNEVRSRVVEVLRLRCESVLGGGSTGGEALENFRTR